jgi:hypothetical protein
MASDKRWGHTADPEAFKLVEQIRWEDSLDDPEQAFKVAKAVARIRRALPWVTPDTRVALLTEIFNDYCHACGSHEQAPSRCYCENDE